MYVPNSLDNHKSQQNIKNPPIRMNILSETGIFGKVKQGITGNRRALGDITNNVTVKDNDKDGTKKQALSWFNNPPVSVVATAQEERSYMLREYDDIDARDESNPLLCSEYVNDMYEIFYASERTYQVNPNYMSTQSYINEKMRTILADWLVEVHLKFKMVPETLYLTVNIIDRYLSQKQVRRSKLQLVGVSALLVASKYEEIYPPELRDLIYITDKAYNKQEILQMENEIINTLHWNMTVPTVHAFLCRFLKAAHADRTMVQLACYIAERTLQEQSMVKYLPSVVAASAVYAARTSLRRHPWSPTLVKYTKLDEPQLAACLADMKAFIIDPEASQQQAVSRKYATARFGSVSKMPICL
jgi:G2/mitotic-specific cyclin-B, other